MDNVAYVDASPLILLGQTGRLDLLQLAATRVIAPRLVMDEICAHGLDDVSVRAVVDAPWIETRPTTSTPTEIAVWDLGAGESQVLALARSTESAVAVVDDLAARRCARTLGIAVRGTLGLILIARRRGHIPAARPVIEELRNSGMRLAEEVMNRALREVGE